MHTPPASDEDENLEDDDEESAWGTEYDEESDTWPMSDQTRHIKGVKAESEIDEQAEAVRVEGRNT